jgi:hypothetical protein
VLKGAGGFGCFQWFMMTFYIMAFSCANLVLYNIDYLTQRPVYMCETAPDSDEYEVCQNTDICEMEHPPKWYIDWDNEFSLNNWS